MQTYGYNQWLNNNPKINKKGEEDLNLNNMAIRLVCVCLNNKQKYHNLYDIVSTTGMSMRTVSRIISNNELKKVINEQQKKTGKVHKMLQPT